MPLELHCHSLFSVDGRGTPEDLVDTAADRGITVLALTDHNTMGGLARARARAEARGIRFIPGMEMDAVWRGGSRHFVALGVDPENAPLKALAGRNFDTYARTFGLYLPHLESRFPGIEVRLREALPARYPSHPAPVLNQWFARDVLLQQGLVADRDTFGALMADIRKEVAAERGRDGAPGFACLEETLAAVRGAGGILVAAHVAQYDPGDAEAQLTAIREGIRDGLDGFELYHPLNLAEPHFDRLATEASEFDCVATGGSDCHDAGQNEKNPIAGVQVPDALLGRIDAALNARRG